MATSDMTTSLLTDMNLTKNGSSQQKVYGGGGESELTQKKHKQPRRGIGVEQLERLLFQQRKKKMTEIPLIHPHRHHFPPFNPSVGFPISGCAAVPNSSINNHHALVPTPAMVDQGIGIHGVNLYSADLSVNGLSGGGFRFENSKEFSSISNYMKCGSDGCGVGEKEQLINGGSNSCSVNPFRSFCGNNTIVEMMDAGKTRRSSRKGKMDWGKLFCCRGWWCGSKE